MIDSEHHNPFIYLVKRAITVLRTEGPAKFMKRIRDRLFLKPLQSHSFVYGNKYCADYPVPICEVELEFREITAVDNDEIDELTQVDEWHTSKSFTLKKLEEGEHIYIAKHKGRIVASHSVVKKDKFEDIVFRREFKMAPNEAYYWRGFCVPAFRGHGILPALGRYLLTDMALKYGRSDGLAFVMTTNKSSQRAVSKYGWVKVGRAGFIEIFGIRFHYLWGREAFKENRRRFLIQNMG
jgi:GNAT superfamily N-acetyltransferase